MDYVVSGKMIGGFALVEYPGRVWKPFFRGGDDFPR